MGDEPYKDAAVEQGLVRVAHAPTELASLAILASMPNEQVTFSEWRAAVNKAQGDEPGWLLDDSSRRTFRDHLTGLFLSGYVEFGDSKKPLLISPTDAGLSGGLALAGTMLELEAQQAFSAHQVFGSKPRMTDGAHSTTSRLEFLSYLSRKIGEPVSLHGASRDLSMPVAVTRYFIAALEEDGIVQVFNKSNPADRLLRFVKPKPRTVGPRVPIYSPAITAAYDIATKCRERRQYTIDGQSFIDEITERYRHLDATRVWSKVVRDTPSFIQFVDSGRFGKDTNTMHTVELTDEYKDVIPVLVDSIEALLYNPVFRKIAAARALEIAHDTQALAYIFAKGRAITDKSADAHETYALRAKSLQTGSLGGASIKRRLTFDGSWVQDAACRDEDPELFFVPDEDEELTTEELQMYEDREAAARAICAQCPVDLQCLKTAVEEEEPYSIRAATTPPMRKELPRDTASLLRMVTIRS